MVDNGSHGESPDMVVDYYPQVNLIRNTYNRGFGRANNQSLKISQDRYSLVLNSDTGILDRTLDSMVAFMNTHPDTAVTAGKVYDSDQQDNVTVSSGNP